MASACKSFVGENAELSNCSCCAVAFRRFSQLLCLLFFLQIVVYLPGNTLAVSLLRYGSFAVSAAFDNFMVAFLVTRRKWVAFVASMVLATLYGVFAAIVIPLAPCKWCDYYVSQIPATRMIEFPYLAFGCAYLLLALCARYQWSFRWFPTPRPALQGWAGMLAISYIFGGGGMMILNTTPIDLGFCLVDFGVLWYTLACTCGLSVVYSFLAPHGCVCLGVQTFPCCTKP